MDVPYLTTCHPVNIGLIAGLPRASLGAHCFPRLAHCWTWLAHCFQGPKAHFQIWKCALFQKNNSNKIGKNQKKKWGMVGMMVGNVCRVQGPGLNMVIYSKIAKKLEKIGGWW